ncbi:hypothetical protein ZIOFF_018142 [Zingiber officinale]|uniref:MULE transposase domain-containing protein n=1 Tax=Zingiber officinale TaxID=94328 RepID=A0A8J5HW70_ZINOF|nr:hypothetical protein ZIOFF_018142 [Zingiber officinale]
MQSQNSNFFYVLDLDEESRIRNVFWADARCRAAYDYFSDVVTFDTTYLTNSYDMSFAPFVGVNHHGQSILLGCGLLSSEDSETFKWLFKSWLTCMLGCAPKAIITDQCRAMTIAIEEIFLDSHHRLCLWHIMKKLPAKLGGHAQYKLIKKQLKNIVYNSLTIDECDENWMKMIEDFNLENNDWLKSLYEQRNRWIPVYVKDKFWADTAEFISIVQALKGGLHPQREVEALLGTVWRWPALVSCGGDALQRKRGRLDDCGPKSKARWSASARKSEERKGGGAGISTARGDGRGGGSGSGEKWLSEEEGKNWSTVA